MCEISDCPGVPHYGTILDGVSTPLRCHTHRKGFIRLGRTHCDCGKRAYYGTQYGVTLYCNICKLPDMVDVRNRKCIYSGCTKRPHYNLPGTTVGLYCSEHKLPDMVDVKSRKCIYSGCNKQPTYNLPGTTVGRYCLEHKLPDMVDVKNRKCIYSGCNTRPTYNLPGTTVGKYCLEHKLPDMVDVISRKCIYSGCNTSAWFGEIGHQPTSCAKHRSKQMVKYPRKRCIHPKCTEVATHQSNGERTHCCFHVVEGDHTLLDKCASCGLEYILYGDRKCESCTNMVYQLYRHGKELEIKQLLDVNMLYYTSHDKLVDAGECVKYRPDFLFLSDGWAVVLEVDEYQHKDRQEHCECIRMVNIYQAMAMPVVFIRYNPDNYRGERATKAARQKNLLSWLKHCIAVKPEFNLSIIKLYFDGYSSPGAIVELPV